MSLQILKPDSELWESLFESLPLQQQDVFYSPAFAQLCQDTVYREHEVLCAAFVKDRDAVLYPFVKRNLAQLTRLTGIDGLHDITGLYGRGGLVGSPGALAGIGEFHAAMADYCAGESIVCGFDRFHPLIGNDACAAPGARVMDIGGFVAVDMRPAPDEIERSFKQSVRKDLRKAERNGISCFAEANCAHLGDFLDIYYHTMDRNAASGFYYFSEEYFRVLADRIHGQFHFFYAVVNGEIVSCELVLHHGRYCHSFLGGTRKPALPLCANPLLKREIITYLKGRGCEYFLLGGGLRADDGMFKFKLAYAPEGVYPSRIGGMIWDPHAYQKLRDEMTGAGVAIPAGRFQFYDTN